MPTDGASPGLCIGAEHTKGIPSPECARRPCQSVTHEPGSPSRRSEGTLLPLHFNLKRWCVSHSLPREDPFQHSCLPALLPGALLALHMSFSCFGKGLELLAGKVRQDGGGGTLGRMLGEPSSHGPHL